MGHLPMSKTCFWPVPECPSNRSMLHRVSITEKQGLETLGRIDDLSFQNPEIDPTLARNPPKSPLPSDCATPPTIRQFIPGKLEMLPDDCGAGVADPLMQETLDFLKSWHHSREAENSSLDGRDMDSAIPVASARTAFQKKLDDFASWWNSSYTGNPKHKCRQGRLVSRAEAVERMAASFITLLLTTLPAIPAPNKWTKIFPISDFVGLGTLVNSFLPNIFQLAFQPVMFSTDAVQEDADPRLLEGLLFPRCSGQAVCWFQIFSDV